MMAPMKTTQLYGIPNCDTVKKARDWLTDQGVDYVFHDFKKQGVPAELLPFCESDGDYYCLKTNGRVLYWSDEGSINESWPNLATWIQQVWMEEQEEQDEDEEPEEDDDE